MSVRAIKNILDDNQIKQFIIPNGQFLKSLNNNFKKTQIDSNYKDIRKKERKWGISKIKKYKIPFNGALNFWSGPFGEHYIYSVLINRGNEARRPDPMNGFTPDWECDDYIYEVKTRNYTSTGSIGEKALGIPLKYCEIPELYKKPLKIVLVGKMEFEGIHKYGIIKNDNYSQNISEIKQKLIDVYKGFGIEFIGASQL
tara:strand:- start:2410 stop:3006 length:597 start_codon:yes stop_codon:yes gene_type:complete